MSRIADLIINHGPLKPGDPDPLHSITLGDFNALREDLVELTDLRQLFDIQRDRMAEASARWRAEDPEARSLSLPDLGDLLQWLMNGGGRSSKPGAVVPVQLTERQLRERIGYEIRARLVCCDIFQRTHQGPDWERASQGPHSLCYWGEASARIAENIAEEEP